MTKNLNYFNKYWNGCDKGFHLWEQIYECTKGLTIELPMQCKIICRSCKKQSKGLYYPSLGKGFDKIVEVKDE